MKFLKQSRKTPKISLVLLDWSVRESFHLLHYLAQQTIPADDFEVIIIEYYSTVSKAILAFETHVDAWILLEMPASCYYHKHLMYNIGVICAKGDIVVICDSDAMVKPTFLASILDVFATTPAAILHLDQFRNTRQDLYPFCYPEFSEVTGSGCINYQDGKTTGVCVTHDRIHYANYGACFCARRADIIKIGGADEHIDFVGYVCGPYDLTFRLRNIGHREIWHQTEFLYHTWHPGQTGINNYSGPHDGRHLALLSLEALFTKRITPHVKNAAIEKLQQSPDTPLQELLALSISPYYANHITLEILRSKQALLDAKNSRKFYLYNGFIIQKNQTAFEISPLLNRALAQYQLALPNDSASSLENCFKKINAMIRHHNGFFITLITQSFWVIRLYQRIKAKKQLKTQRSTPTAAQHSMKKSYTYTNIFHKIQRIFSSLQNAFSEAMQYKRAFTAYIAHAKYLQHISNKPSTLLLISSPTDKLYLSLLMKIKCLPAMSIINVSNAQEVSQLTATNNPIFLATYTAYHQLEDKILDALNEQLIVIK